MEHGQREQVGEEQGDAGQRDGQCLPTCVHRLNLTHNEHELSDVRQRDDRSVPEPGATALPRRSRR